ncbi:MAG: STM4014 family protein [Candidatus Methylumidiphilus sp.]
MVLAAPDGKRVRLLQAARAGLGLPPARVVAWSAFLQAPETLTVHWRKPCRFKLEPPNDDPAAQHRLLQDGCALLDQPPPAPLAQGELRAVDIWHVGFAQAMRRIAALLAEHPQVEVLNAPAEALLMADKLACQQHLQTHGIATPRLLGPVENYRHLRGLLDQHGLDRAYLKARYGSSAAGVVAYRRNRRGQEQAISSAHREQGRLINRKRLRRYANRDDIQSLIDLVARQGAYAEAWVNKPRLGNGHFDIRMLALGGAAAHRVARIGERAITNLHLDNRRGEVAALLDADTVHALEQTAERAAAAFPRSRVIGFDLVASRGQAQVLEANAFGDLLPGLLWQDEDVYSAELRRWA